MDTFLVKFYKKFINSFHIWKAKDNGEGFLKRMLEVRNYGGRYITYTSIIRDYADVIHNQYLPPTYSEANIKDVVDEDFKDARNIVQWIKQNYYDLPENSDLLSIDENTYIFNWGEVPKDKLDGITPDALALKHMNIYKTWNKKGIEDFKQKRSMIHP